MVQHGKLRLVMLVSYSGWSAVQVSAAPSLIQLSVHVPGKVADDGSSTRVPATMWETWIEFLASGFSMRHLWSELTEKSLSFPVSVTMPFKKLIFK